MSSAKVIAATKAAVLVAFTLYGAVQWTSFVARRILPDSKQLAAGVWPDGNNLSSPGNAEVQLTFDDPAGYAGFTVADWPPSKSRNIANYVKPEAKEELALEFMKGKDRKTATDKYSGLNLFFTMYFL